MLLLLSVPRFYFDIFEIIGNNEIYRKWRNESDYCLRDDWRQRTCVCVYRNTENVSHIPIIVRLFLCNVVEAKSVLLIHRYSREQNNNTPFAYTRIVRTR